MTGPGVGPSQVSGRPAAISWKHIPPGYPFLPACEVYSPVSLICFLNLVQDCCLIACAGWLLVLQSAKTGQWSAWHVILGWQIYSRRNLHQLIACCICQHMDCQVINIHMSQGFPWQRHELMRRCLNRFDTEVLNRFDNNDLLEPLLECGQINPSLSFKTGFLQNPGQRLIKTCLK